MHPYAHSSTIYNNRDVETTSMPMNRRMDKEEVAYLYDGMLLSLKKNEIIPHL